MSQAALRSKRLAFVAALTTLVLVTSEVAFADPCAEACRSQHNSCRMDAKLLFAPRCDAALQACISGCFTQGRFRRDRDHDRGGFGEHGPRDFRGAPENRGQPEFRGHPEMHGPRGAGRNRR
jgi:hypothetical protein